MLVSGSNSLCTNVYSARCNCRLTAESYANRVAVMLTNVCECCSIINERTARATQNSRAINYYTINWRTLTNHFCRFIQTKQKMLESEPIIICSLFLSYGKLILLFNPLTHTHNSYTLTSDACIAFNSSYATSTVFNSERVLHKSSEFHMSCSTIYEEFFIIVSGERQHQVCCCMLYTLIYVYVFCIHFHLRCACVCEAAETTKCATITCRVQASVLNLSADLLFVVVWPKVLLSVYDAAVCLLLMCVWILFGWRKPTAECAVPYQMNYIVWCAPNASATERLSIN